MERLFRKAGTSTSALKENEQLFTGLKPIEYSNYEANTYADSVKEEMEFEIGRASCRERV